MSNNFHKTSLLKKNHELETFGTTKKILGKKLEGCSCARKRPVAFRTFHTFPCIFFREKFLVAVHGWFAIETNVWMYSRLKNLKLITATYLQT